jgi:DNA polymerase-3 subunit gamma/tau
MILRRETSSGSNDLNVVFRPCLIDEMLGNDTNKRIIKNALDSRKTPHTQLFTGDAGCGKTTAAKIVALGLNCETNDVSSEPCLECTSCKSILEGYSMDVREINVGQTGGKDHVDAIVKDLPLAPFNTRYKVLIFDEAHELTAAAKDLLLKPIESGYEHVYFIFCTNQPEKLRSKKKDAGEAFLDRCSVLDFKRVEIEEIKQLLQNICEFEGFHYNTDVIDLVAEESKGVPRNAIVWLNQVALEGSWLMSAAKDICSVMSDVEEPMVLELCKALTRGSWKESLDIFANIKTVPVETLRISVAGWFVACLKRAKKFGDGKKFSAVLDIVTIPIYEQGKLAEHKWYNYMFKIVDTIMAHGRGN